MSKKNVSASYRLQKATTFLMIKHPFFASLLKNLSREASPRTEFLAADGNVLYYNEEALENSSLSDQQLAGALAHISIGLGLQHHLRRNGRDKKVWKEACDHVANNTLEDMFPLPKGTFCDPKYKNMTAEQVYNLIQKEQSQQQNSSGQGQGKGTGGGNNSGGGGGQDKTEQQDSPFDQDPGGDGDCLDFDKERQKEAQQRGYGAANQAQMADDWQQNMANAITAAKMQGNLPASIERLMGELFEAKIDWREVLMRFCTMKAPDDFSWNRCNRRFIAQGIYLPSRQSDDAMDTMVCTIDTSGSIGQKELDEFGSEIAFIHSVVKPRRLLVIYCDAAINKVDEFGPNDELIFKLHGGGGTSFIPPFKWLETNNVVPNAFVYLTDGYGDFPAEPQFPTLWCINNHNVVPPFGEHLVLEV